MGAQLKEKSTQCLSLVLKHEAQSESTLKRM